MSPSDPRVVRGGDPSPEELAAIVAAVEVSWPRPVVVDEPRPASIWRFSNRWWLPRRPMAVARRRP